MKRFWFTLLTLLLLAGAIVSAWYGYQTMQEYSRYVPTTAHVVSSTPVGCSDTDCNCDGTHYRVKWSYEVSGHTLTTRSINSKTRPESPATIYYNPGWPISYTFNPDAGSILIILAVALLIAAICSARQARIAFIYRE